MVRDFMTDAGQLRDLEGQQYVVLRPTGAVATEFDRMQDAARRRIDAAGLSDAVRYPGAAHVTLRGLYEPERVDQVREVVRRWAARQHPIELAFDAVDSFPAPWQIVIARLARTPSLLHAYASLTEALDDTDLRRIGELSLDEWTFHLSTVYAKNLDAADWARLASDTAHDYATPPAETIGEVEFVTYFDAAEHREVFPLGAG
ncbi:2'-5' RNA ligase family protein [Microbacterium sp. H1-D42]|uniref:2'-5' RNA ligase family protein n=1 Tax=Microbacterium sp. H1-D42 TaxID=2925844 RepID=UPI001F5319FC|nr:2'-5' RNA ligase family protein [Microbacterium sp. H1-D42]UNK70208.1 2'-5' RNA ligase family protein [Microbacterium sp. H1-D42]